MQRPLCFYDYWGLGKEVTKVRGISLFLISLCSEAALTGLLPHLYGLWGHRHGYQSEASLTALICKTQPISLLAMALFRKKLRKPGILYYKINYSLQNLLQCNVTWYSIMALPITSEQTVFLDYCDDAFCFVSWWKKNCSYKICLAWWLLLAKVLNFCCRVMACHRTAQVSKTSHFIIDGLIGNNAGLYGAITSEWLSGLFVMRLHYCHLVSLSTSMDFHWLCHSGLCCRLSSVSQLCAV